MTELWTSNTTPDEIADRLRAASRIALLTHSKPDGDAVGSTLSLARALRHAGKQAWPVYLAPWPRRFDEVVGPTPVIHESHGCFDAPPLDSIDTAVVIDTGSWGQVADARPWLEKRPDRTIVIDHHRHGDADMAALRWIVPEAAAAAELSAHVCIRLLRLPSAADLPGDVAEAVYLGLATDTGWFRFSNTTDRTMSLAAELMRAGVDANRLYRIVEQNDTAGRLRLMGRALNSVKLHEGPLGRDSIASMTLSLRDFAECGANQDDSGGFTDLPQALASVKVVAFFTELEPSAEGHPVTKVSLRSKAGDPWVDVNAVAKSMGGGGHVHAAGMKLKAPMSEALERVLGALRA
ncbi:MAG: DHH family phosphoesterase [Phycisphaerales bacterium]|nr:DHH family phosphoesterase [Phycisphaerales bacterium]